MIPDKNRQNLRKVRIGYWHHEQAKWEGGKVVAPRVKEVRFPKDAPEGYLHGFSTEGDADETCVVALVELADGTFQTPSITVIKTIN